MLLKIVQAGEPVLRRRARALSREEILSPAMQHLVVLMRETMRDAPGVGLAAPQIGEPLQVAVIEDRADYLDGMPTEWLAERERRAVPFHAIFNPTLTVLDETRVEFFEGCLSVEGYAALVPRARKVKVEALDDKAEPVTIVAEGWYARILQHEIDHLYGRLYVDRMESRTLCTSENQGRFWAGFGAREIHAFLDAEADKTK